MSQGQGNASNPRKQSIGTHSIPCADAISTLRKQGEQKVNLPMSTPKGSKQTTVADRKRKNDGETSGVSPESKKKVQ